MDILLKMKKTTIRCKAFDSFLKDYASDIEYINRSVFIRCGLPNYIVDLKMCDAIFPKPLELFIGRVYTDYFCNTRVFLGDRVLFGGLIPDSISNLRELLDPIFWVNPINIINSINNEDLRKVLENDLKEFDLKHSEIIVNDDTKITIHFKLTNAFITAMNNSDIWEIGYYYPGTKKIRRKMSINKNSDSLSRIVGV